MYDIIILEDRDNMDSIMRFGIEEARKNMNENKGGPAFQKRTAFFCPQVEKKKDFPAGLSVLSAQSVSCFAVFMGH